MPSKKFIYASVRFIGEDTYFYRTDDAMLREGDVVSVPTQKGEDIATVVSIKSYEEKKVPYPLDKTKFITRVVGPRIGVYMTEADRRARSWTGEDRKKPEIDWSGRPSFRLEHISLFKKFYECGYCHSCYNVKFPVCPCCRKHTDGKMTMLNKKIERERHKKVPTASWIKQKHMNGKTDYKSSGCGKVFRSPSEYCFNCKSHRTNEKCDPVWVDEMSEYDDIFGD